jgi:uncharacterized ion transporter superfamily protein YfcC
MPEQNGQIVESQPVPSGQQPSDRPLIDETVSAHIMQMFGNSQQYQPTQAQVDKILSLQEKGMDYTHEERTCFSPKQKIELAIFVCSIIVLVLVFLHTLWYAKEYLGEVIASIVGFLAGGSAGFAYAKTGSKKRDEN